MATFTNQATLTYGGDTVVSNVVTGELVTVLSATKTAAAPAYAQGEIITYVIMLRNTGTTAVEALTVTDDLASYSFTPTDAATITLTPLRYVEGSLRYFTNGVLQTTPTVTAGENTLTVAPVTVPAGGTATLVYEVRVNTFAPTAANSVLTNTVTVTGAGLATSVQAEAVIEAENRPRLAITKGISPAAVAENGTLTYTITVQNYGMQAVTEGLVVSDTFDPILRSISATYNGDAWTNYTYDTTTGVFTTVANAVSVPAATDTVNETTGAHAVVPGTTVITVTGTV